MFAAAVEHEHKAERKDGEGPQVAGVHPHAAPNTGDQRIEGRKQLDGGEACACDKSAGIREAIGGKESGTAREVFDTPDGAEQERGKEEEAGDIAEFAGNRRGQEARAFEQMIVDGEQADGCERQGVNEEMSPGCRFVLHGGCGRKRDLPLHLTRLTRLNRLLIR